MIFVTQQISAHICDHRGGFVKAISFLAEKKTASIFHSLALCVSVFNFTHFDWLPAHFSKCSDTQLIRQTRSFSFILKFVFTLNKGEMTIIDKN